VTTDVMGLVLMTVTQPRTSARQVQPVQPLLPEDPPKVGEFWLRGRLTANAAGIVYAGRDETGRDAAVAMMAEGSADDAAARDRFGHAADQLPADVVLARNSADDDDLALWVAVTDPGEDRPGPDLDGRPPQVTAAAHEHAATVLSAVLMDRIPHVGRFRGPDFLHHWDGRRRPGLFRLWPLPWPAALRTASRMALILSLLTMLLLMALAILIAWLLFRNQPEVDPGPVIPDPNGTQTVTVTPSSPQTTGPGPTPNSGSPSSVPRPSTGPPSSGQIPTGIPSSGGSPGDPGDRF
jgi:hypothetical protein